jgi:antitoxin PrlF
MNDKEKRAVLDEKGRIKIPGAFRKALDMKSGDPVVLCLKRDELRLTTLRARIAQAQRRVRKYVEPGVSLVDELLAERRAEAKREAEE